MRLALLAAMPLYVPALADDAFIVQPKLRADRPAAAAPIHQPQTFHQHPGLSQNQFQSRSQRQTPISPPPKAAGLQWVTRGSSVRGVHQSASHAVNAEDSSRDWSMSQASSLEFVQRVAPAIDREANMARPIAIEVQSLTLDLADTNDLPPFQAVTPVPDEAISQTNATPTTVPVAAIDEEREARTVRAALVSSQILGTAPHRSGRAPARSVDTTPGWQAVGERLTRHLRQSELLLRRNAFFSAREEAEAAAIYLVRVLDLGSNSYLAEPRLLSAQRALTEADDFAFSQRLTTDQDFLERVIESHQTDVLKSADVSRMSPLVAAQHYRQHAQQSLIDACQNHPWGSEVYYMLGRTYQAQAEQGAPQADSLRWRAVTFYRAAVAIAPRSAIATNQLGFLLLQMDRPQDARTHLIASVAADLNEPALENLVEVSRRLNDATTQNWALQNLAHLRHMRPPETLTPQVTEVDPQTFMALSPYTIGPQRPTPSEAAAHTANLAPNNSYQR